MSSYVRGNGVAMKTLSIVEHCGIFGRHVYNRRKSNDGH